MNVAIFASAYYPHVGGVEEAVRQLAAEYRARGIKPIILTNRWPRSLPPEQLYEKTPVYRLAMRTPEGGLKGRINYRLTHRAICQEMIEILQKHRIDLLHVQCVSSNGLYAHIAARELRLPLIVTTQGERTMDAGQLYQRSPFMNGVLRDLLAKADHITACSRHTLDDMERYWGTPFGARAGVVYNGIDLSNFEGAAPHTEDAPYILGIGRLVPQKGFDILLRAFAQADISGWKLLIAGEGPEREPLEKLASKLGLGERAQLIGRADRTKAAALFRGCECFVLPSRMEPLGIVNLEAMAAGKMVIASRTGGVPEIVAEGETGLLFPPEDEAALASALTKAAGDPSLRERYGAAGRQAVEAFTWPVIADQYNRIYRDALARRNPALAAA
ncbi:MAG TPA: glycosyltransferase family 4 protein [Chthoniobacteraceae bacterium]|jgi:glycosyltransferase involved in cell wall biosynthesis|nr:glycosyltransferase family 4 protein [Chthoniobacteraceae bacterium]